MPARLAGLWSGASGDELADHPDQGVVDAGRFGEDVAAVHDPMTDRVDRPVEPVDLRNHLTQRGRMVEHLLDDAAGEAFAGVGVDELVLDRRAAGVEHEHQHRRPQARSVLAARSAPTWMAVMAIVLTMSVTVAPRDRSLTGLLRPCSTGPTATAPAERCTAL